MSTLVEIQPCSPISMGEFQSGQMEQTVNLLGNSFEGSNPSSPTNFNNMIVQW